MKDKIKISGIIRNSITDGVGIRYVIFVQGCSHNCKGCHNPETHDYNKNVPLISIDDILKDIKLHGQGTRGITLSGGDPLFLMNLEGVTTLCKEYKKEFPDKTIWLYTGYTIEELDITQEIFKYIDVLVDGRFIENQKSLELKFKGSKNQRIINIPQTMKQNKIILEEVD